MVFLVALGILIKEKTDDVIKGVKVAINVIENVSMKVWISIKCITLDPSHVIMILILCDII